MATSENQSRILAVLGPTNTGKTHYAIERMLGHSSGMIGLPLRLLAREIYDRVVGIKGENAVALVTGEEKIVPKHPSYWVTTVESMPLDVSVECLAVDEIQLAADPERGHVFTDRLLRARGRSETLFLGADTMRPLIAKLVPGIQFLSRPRFSDLAYTGARKLTRLPRRSVIVAFSAQGVYEIAELVRRHRGGAAVVLGALSPRTRNAQVALYQSGDVDFLVATDAIGMGLNMDVDHVAFAETDKFDGTVRRALKANELAQIAGRAGRHMNDGTFGVTGEANPIDAETVEAIENHRFDPVRVAQWRSPDLDFSSISGLNQSLDALPPMRGLARAKTADDAAVLRLLAENPQIKDIAIATAAIKQLWDVCQIPDFRKLAIDEHAQLLTSIYQHLMGHEGVLPEDWMEGNVSRLDNAEGEIDTIAMRIAHIRTWTYVANRPGWLAQPEHWQERTRAVEDKLSDALHERLTQRFIDRRTSVLMRRLREDEEFTASIDGDGEVLVEGEYVGRLQGFAFVPDPRALGVHGRALRAAALKGLSSEIADRAHKLSIAPEAAITLSEHGRLWWNGGIVGSLSKGADTLQPKVELLADDTLSQSARDRAQYRLQGWVNGHIDKVLAPLIALQAALNEPSPSAKEPLAVASMPDAPVERPESSPPAEVDGVVLDSGDAEQADSAAVELVLAPGHDEQVEPEAENAETPEPPVAAKEAAATDAPKPLSGQARGLIFQLLEALGAISRNRVGEQLRALDHDSRATLRRLGFRFGQYSVFLPALIKPAAARLKALLWAVHQGLRDIPPAPQPGLTSIAADPSTPPEFLSAAGYRVCGTRAVRVDMLERLADLIRSKGTSGQVPQQFEASGDMMSILGSGADELAAVLKGLGFREAEISREDGTQAKVWRTRAQPRERKSEPEKKEHGRARYKGPRKDEVIASTVEGAPAVAPDGVEEPQKVRATKSGDERFHERKKRRENESDQGKRPRFEGKERTQARGERAPRDTSREKPREETRRHSSASKPQKAADPDSPFAMLSQIKFKS